MNMTQTNIRNGSIALVAFMLLASAAFFAPTAHAADMGIDYGYDVYDYSAPAYDYGTPSYGYDVYDYSAPAYDYGYDVYDYSAPAYDYGYDVYDYSSPSYGGGYSSGFGGGMGGFSLPFMGGGSGGGNTQSQSQGQSQSQSSNNTNVNNNVITITQPTPTVVQSVCPVGTYGTYPNCVYPQTQVCPIGSTGTYPNCVYPQPTYDICPNIPGIQNILPAGYYLQNGNCFQQYAPTPTPYTPYVTLSAVPYTGLELGPIGTFLYWAFLVLWCLAAAYLVVVKKVQNRVVASLNKFFFGSNTHAKVSHKTMSVAVAAPASLDTTDEFIASQINRVR